MYHCGNPIIKLMLNYNLKTIIDHWTILRYGWSQDDIKTFLSLRARLGHL